MSSLKIKGMRLPESCSKCPLALMTRYAEHICFITDYMIEDDE